jgi:hypothetical protein
MRETAAAAETTAARDGYNAGSSVRWEEVTLQPNQADAVIQEVGDREVDGLGMIPDLHASYT